MPKNKNKTTIIALPPPCRTLARSWKAGLRRDQILALPASALYFPRCLHSPVPDAALHEGFVDHIGSAGHTLTTCVATWLARERPEQNARVAVVVRFVQDATYHKAVRCTVVHDDGSVQSALDRGGR
jgi:hypothetical protein